MQVSGEDVRGNRCSPRGYFSQLVRSLVVASGDVVELEPVELVFQVPNLIAVGFQRLLLSSSATRQRTWSRVPVGSEPLGARCRPIQPQSPPRPGT
jgi:hypothetical protein